MIRVGLAARFDPEARVIPDLAGVVLPLRLGLSGPGGGFWGDLPARRCPAGGSQNRVVLRTRWRVGHVTPERVLHSNLAVAARELIESKAAKLTCAPSPIAGKRQSG